MMAPLYKNKGFANWTFHSSFFSFFQRMFCITCDQVFDKTVDEHEHQNHDVEMLHGDTLFLLGWGHLEAKLHSCFMNVSFKGNI